MTLSVEQVRARFPLLGADEARFDGPAGTQVPSSVIDAISRYLLTANANVGGLYPASLETEDLLRSARHAAASAESIGRRPALRRALYRVRVKARPQ